MSNPKGCISMEGKTIIPILFVAVFLLGEIGMRLYGFCVNTQS